MYRKLCLVTLVIFLLAFGNAIGQTNLKGLWNGYITTDNHDARAGYLLSIEEHNGGIVSGKALLYKPNLFAHAYGLQQFYGFIGNNTITINDVQILDEILPSSRFHLCFKLSKLYHNVNKDSESLEGDWSSNTINCLPGKIILFRVDQSQQEATIPPHVLRALKTKDIKPVFKNTSLATPIVLEVNRNILELELRDYLKEDSDSVTVYLNRKAILSNLKISKKPYKFNIVLNRQLAVNELILYANNLGDIPPNTSFLTIKDGEKNHKLLIESSLQKSVAIYIKRK